MQIEKFFDPENKTLPNEDAEELKSIVKKYPYFTSAKVVLTRYYYQKKDKAGFSNLMNHLKYEHPNRNHIKTFATSTSSLPIERIGKPEEKKKEAIKLEKKTKSTTPSINPWRNVQKTRKSVQKQSDNAVKPSESVLKPIKNEQKSTSFVTASAEVLQTLERRKIKERELDELLSLAKETKKTVTTFFDKYVDEKKVKKPAKKKATKTVSKKKTTKTTTRKKKVKKEV